MIKKMTILGAGETGSFLASEFSQQQQNFEVTIIDKNPNILKGLADRLNIATVEGLGTDVQSLKKAINNDCDLFIACAQNDETNLISCIYAKTLQAKTTIAIIKSQFYLDEEVIKNYKQSGVDYLLNIGQIITDEIIDSVDINIDISEMTRFFDEKVIILGIKITEGFPFIGKKLSEIRFGFPCLIGSILRDEEAFIPKGQDAILENDYIYINLAKENMHHLNQLLRTSGSIKKTAVVAGDDEIAPYVMRQLIKHGYQVQSIKDIQDTEIDHQNFETIQANPFDIKTLLRANTANSNLFISLFYDDTKNIVLNHIANYLGVNRSIYLVNRKDLVKIANQFSGIHLSKRLLIFRNITKIIRFGSDKQDFTTIGETSMEVLTYDVKEQSDIVDQMIKDIQFPKNSLAAALIDERKQVIIPEGSTQLKANHKILIFSLPENIDQLEKLFS